MTAIIFCSDNKGDRGRESTTTAKRKEIRPHCDRSGRDSMNKEKGWHRRFLLFVSSETAIAETSRTATTRCELNTSGCQSILDVLEQALFRSRLIWVVVGEIKQ